MYPPPARRSSPPRSCAPSAPGRASASATSAASQLRVFILVWLLYASVCLEALSGKC